MGFPKCVFCLSESASFSTREHILPESLGGGDWGILPPGLFCDVCQNRFGSAIEQQALGDYPFNLLRTFLGIPTKKKQAPWFKSWEGTLIAGGAPGRLIYEPPPDLVPSVERREKTVMRFPTYPRRPEMVCRTLLKMGIEVIAFDNPDDAFKERYDDARTFALSGVKDGAWWYIQEEDLEFATRLFTGKASEDDWNQGGSLEVRESAEGIEMFYLRLLYLRLATPLQCNAPVPKDHSGSLILI